MNDSLKDFIEDMIYLILSVTNLTAYLVLNSNSFITWGSGVCGIITFILFHRTVVKFKP